MGCWGRALDWACWVDLLLSPQAYLHHLELHQRLFQTYPEKLEMVFNTIKHGYVK